MVNVSVASVSPHVANVSADIPVAFASCSAVYFVLAEDKVAIVIHSAFCSSVNNFEDNNTFCCATSKALKEVNNCVVLPVLFKTVDIFFNCSLNIVLLLKYVIDTYKTYCGVMSLILFQQNVII